MSSKTIISKDLENKQLNITREFDAPVEQVWNAWTQAELLDQWWAPKPWKTKTSSMNFAAGGTWLYSMVGPDGTEQFCRADYQSIEPLKSYSGLDAFCDDKGMINEEFPRMHWKCVFTGTGNKTLVNIQVTFAAVADLEKIIEMGFSEGFTAAHGNLDELLKK